MRDLSKTKSKRKWVYEGYPEGFSGNKCFAEIRTGKRGAEYFCLWIVTEIPGMMGSKPIKSLGLRDARDLHMTTLQDAAVHAVELKETHDLPDEWLESVLDFIYSELNRRLNKAK